MGDFATREVLESILKDEDDHMDGIEELQDQIGHMTLPIFLTHPDRLSRIASMKKTPRHRGVFHFSGVLAGKADPHRRAGIGSISTVPLSCCTS